jgi:hypothetical protein
MEASGIHPGQFQQKARQGGADPKHEQAVSPGPFAYGRVPIFDGPGLREWIHRHGRLQDKALFTLA